MSVGGPVSDPHPLAGVLAGVHADSCPGELNFHCHTLCSDGSLTPSGWASRPWPWACATWR